MEVAYTRKDSAHWKVRRGLSIPRQGEYRFEWLKQQNADYDERLQFCKFFNNLFLIANH